MVAVHACFPHSVATAARQKSRWMTGIALAGWDRLGWSGGLAERWMRLRDRRAPLASLVLAAAYLALFGYVVTRLAGLFLPRGPIPTIPLPLILTNMTLLGWRMIWRMALTGRSHGWAMALLVPLHMVIGNIIAIMAAVRAFGLYAGLVSHGRLRWDKTAHVFLHRETAR
jgi:adsorption protein B